MKKVGITGGIGSGKSIVCKIFNIMGIPLYIADNRAKNIMENDLLVREQLTKRFGYNVFIDNKLNRSFLASVIFNDNDAISFVNKLIHPLVEEDFNSWSTHFSYVPYILEEAALLFESGGYQKMDLMITVFAPVEMRIQRIQARDSSNRENILSRMQNQMPDDEKIKMADFVIYNDENTSVIEQVMHIHQTILSFN